MSARSVGGGGGRVSLDDPNTFYAGSLAYLAPFSADEYWRSGKLDTKTLDRVSPMKLMELLSDISPDVSRALWDFLLMCNPGWDVKCFKPGTETRDKNAENIVKEFLKSLHGPYNAPNVTPTDVVIASILIQAPLRGAFCAELVLDKEGRVPLEIATPDPAHIRFRRVEVEARGLVWQPFQLQLGVQRDLDRPTFVYVPVHPFPGNPYGRPMFSPALFTSIFLITILHDIKRVIQQQGWPRLDLEVDFDKLLQMMPEDEREDAVKRKEWLAAAFQDIMDKYHKLQVDHAYVHPDAIKVNRPVGTMNSSGLGAVDGIIQGLERMSMRALKSNPLMMGLGQTASESQANRTWEVYVAGIKSLQHLAENLLERILGLALQVQGIAATVEFRFAELRAAELLRDAQVEGWKIKNARAAYDNGVINMDEQAQMALGKPKADATEPRASGVSQGNALPSGGMAADPGSERSNKPHNEDQ